MVSVTMKRLEKSPGFLGLFLYIVIYSEIV